MQALELHKDQDDDAAAREGGAVPRQRLLARRGRALAQLGRLGEALADYETAKRLDPENHALAKDIEELVSCMKPMDGGLCTDVVVSVAVGKEACAKLVAIETDLDLRILTVHMDLHVTKLRVEDGCWSVELNKLVRVPE